MKIAIMTFWESVNNYGQILQLFASQEVLKKMGHDPYLVKFHRRLDRGTGVKVYLKSLLAIFKSIVKKRNFDHLRQFESFKRRRIIFGDDNYFSLADLKTNPPKADVYYVGSDQVWNNKILVPAEAFLLGFGDQNITRIAYAASFGHATLDRQDQILFKENIDNIDFIGVRENSGVNICNDLGRPDAKFVLDPTLLLKLEEWCELLSLKKKEEKSQIFIYTLGNSDVQDKEMFISFSNQIPGFSVKHASANNDSSGGLLPTIESWVDYIKDSKFVVTTSFHGVIFCLICHTNFIVLPNTGKASGMNERIKSILSLLDLEDHIHDKFNENNYMALLNKKVDWEKIDAKLTIHKEESISFLENALKN